MAVASCMIGAAYAQSVAIYQVTDMTGQTENQILTKEEAAKLATEIKEEAKVLPAIMAEAKKEWEADKENKAPFPAARVKLRTAKKLGSDFSSQEAALKKIEQIDLRTAEKIAQDAKEKESERSNKKQKTSPEDIAKETLRNTLANNAISDVNRRMTEKLGRPVPMFGFLSTSEKKEEKKEAKKDTKKDNKKTAEKK
jgi:hypothetical protein